MSNPYENDTPRSYRPKGGTVKAVKLTATNLIDIAKWCHGRVINGVLKVFSDVDVVTVNVGQYVVMSSDKNVKVLSPEEFEQFYEPVRNPRIVNTV